MDAVGDSRAEAVAVKLAVFALGFGDAATTAEVGFDKAKVCDLAVGRVNERLDFRNGVEVILQKFLGGGPVDLEAVREAEGVHAKDERKIDRLSLPPLVVGNTLIRDIEENRSRFTVDIFVLVEGVNKRLLLGKASNDAVFDLGVIEVDKEKAVSGDEMLAEIIGDILKIR